MTMASTVFTHKAYSNSQHKKRKNFFKDVIIFYE